MTGWDCASGWVMAAALGGQIVLAALRYNHAGLDRLANVGWGVLWLSAVLGWWPIVSLRRHGGVEKGRSYVHTTQLVTRGPYALLRHPQYLAGILLSVGLALIAQVWVSGGLAVVAIACNLFSAPAEEARSLARLGAAYAAYAKEVPRWNLLLGIARWVRRRSS